MAEATSAVAGGYFPKACGRGKRSGTAGRERGRRGRAASTGFLRGQSHRLLSVPSGKPHLSASLSSAAAHEAEPPVPSQIWRSQGPTALHHAFRQQQGHVHSHIKLLNQRPGEFTALSAVPASGRVWAASVLAPRTAEPGLGSVKDKENVPAGLSVKDSRFAV